ncbi:MAG: acetylxylan esterase, partial [Prosthecobacter sp.]
EKVLRPAIEVVIGRTYDQAGSVEWELKDKQDRGEHIEMAGLLKNTTHSEETNVTWLYPKNWNGRVVIWLDDHGKSGLPNDDVKKLVAAGSAVVGADLLFQGEKETRVVKNPREFAGYTHGYNHALFAQRVHDVLSLVSFARNTQVGTHPNPKTVCLAAFGNQTGPIAAAALSLLSGAVDRAAIDTHGFRFGQVLSYRDPMFLPGGSKYLDLPGFLKLAGPCEMWLKGEGSEPAGTALDHLSK